MPPPLPRSSPPLTWPRFAHPPSSSEHGREGREGARNDDLPFHKSNPLFIPGAAIPSSLIPSLPHLAAAYTFIPRGTDAAASVRARGDSRYNFRENGHITQLFPTGFPAGLCPHQVVLYGAMFLVARRLVWEWGNNSLKREGEGERGLVFAQCQTRGERQKFMGVVRARGIAG